MCVGMCCTCASVCLLSGNGCAGVWRRSRICIMQPPIFSDLPAFLKKEQSRPYFQKDSRCTNPTLAKARSEFMRQYPNDCLWSIGRWKNSFPNSLSHNSSKGSAKNRRQDREWSIVYVYCSLYSNSREENQNRGGGRMFYFCVYLFPGVASFFKFRKKHSKSSLDYFQGFDLWDSEILKQAVFSQLFPHWPT